MTKWLVVLCLFVTLLGCAVTPSVEQQRQGLEELMGLAQVAYGDGRMADAERHLHAITERYPDTVTAWLRLGNVFYRTGRFDAAVHAYEQTLRYDSRNGQAWHNLALTRMQQARSNIEAGLGSTVPGSQDYEALVRLQQSLGAVKDSGF